MLCVILSIRHANKTPVCLQYYFRYNLAGKVVNKLTKLSKIHFGMEYFSAAVLQVFNKT